MDAADFQRLKALFDELADLPADERLAVLERATDISADVRRELREMLGLHHKVEHATGQPAIGALRRARTADVIGRRIGAFELERELGHGGMGDVFLAHRADGSVEQKVAVKLIRAERLDQHTLDRFRLERQVLALLKHPNIAALIDLGEFEGRPYAVMEYVEGQPLLEFRVARQLARNERLRLFLAVCDAVSYAHRNMIVHRDIKSRNILVTADGHPKLLDFGIAKPLVSRYGTQDVGETSEEQRFFSPQNAAPEQVRGEPVSVACDVYGLGVLLYELLAGKPPFDLDGKTPGEIERAILETDPAPPSARARDASLRGDLDAIVLRALRKAPEQRYASVEQFADDVTRYLEQRPVAARKGRAWYRVRKFAARNRLALGATAVVLLVVVGAGVALWRSALETIRQRDRAQHATSFLVEAFRAADPEKALGEKVTAKEVLDQAQRSLQIDLADDPALRAELLGRIGEVKLHLAASKDAVEILERALRSAEQSPAAAELRPWLLALRADAATRAAQYDLAEQSIAEAERLHPDVRTRAMLAASNLELRFLQGATKALKPYADEAMRDILPRLSADDPERFVLVAELAKVEQVLDGEQRSIALAEDLLHTSKSTQSGRLLRMQVSLIGYYREAGRDEDGEALGQSIKPAIERLYGENSVALANWANTMGRVIDARGRHEEAIALYRKALAIFADKLGKESPSVAMAQFNIAGNEENYTSDWVDAEKDYREAIRLAAVVWPDTNENIEMFRTAYALFLNKRERFAEAVPLFTTVLARAERNVEFKDDDVFKAAVFGKALAAYALAPTPTQRDAYEAAFAVVSTGSDEVKQMMDEQLKIAERLHLPPHAFAAAEAPAKGP